jgi:hypothetical protein
LQRWERQRHINVVQSDECLTRRTGNVTEEFSFQRWKRLAWSAIDEDVDIARQGVSGGLYFGTRALEIRTAIFRDGDEFRSRFEVAEAGVSDGRGVRSDVRDDAIEDVNGSARMLLSNALAEVASLTNP